MALWAGAGALAGLAVGFGLPVLLSADFVIDFASMSYNMYIGDYEAARWDAVSLLLPGVALGLGAAAYHIFNNAGDGLRFINRLDNVTDTVQFANRADNYSDTVRYVSPIRYIPADEAYGVFRSAQYSDYINLYHGTDPRSAESIRKGIDPKYFQPERDFGFAFYTTLDRGQALDWADDVNPSVLHFKIPKDEFSSLAGYSFRGMSNNWHEFVMNNRLGWKVPNRYADYDYVSGTMLLRPVEYLYGSGITLAGGQQTVFYSQRSFDMLARWLQR